MQPMTDDPINQLDVAWRMPPHNLDLAAARSSPAVLITAPTAVGRRLATELATGRAEQHGDGVAVVEATDRRCLQSALSCAAAGTGRLLAIVVHDVDALDAAQQAAFAAALARIPRQGAHACRIIATTAVWLFDRVREGSFNADLFYRLNTIHIRLDIGPAAGRGSTAAIGRLVDRT
jgi:sigma-54 interacting transcriptional regulator